jgi:anti-anti-sigma regulatory factor
MADRFELPSELNIYSALEIRDAMLTWVSEHGKGQDFLEVSARDVSEIDGAGLQLLASLSNMEHTWHLVETSAAFAEACRTMGFSHWLDKRYLQAGSEGVAA